MEVNRTNCPMRHENGNCLPIGGFCTAVNDIYCNICQSAYNHGLYDGARAAMSIAIPVLQKEIPKKDCSTCENEIWRMPQCNECNPKNGYKGYTRKLSKENK